MRTLTPVSPTRPLRVALSTRSARRSKTRVDEISVSSQLQSTDIDRNKTPRSNPHGGNIIERKTANAVAEVREERFAVVGQMREAFKDIPLKEIERDVVALIRELREVDEIVLRAEEQASLARRP